MGRFCFGLSRVEVVNDLRTENAVSSEVGHERSEVSSQNSVGLTLTTDLQPLAFLRTYRFATYGLVDACSSENVASQMPPTLYDQMIPAIRDQMIPAIYV